MKFLVEVNVWVLLSSGIDVDGINDWKILIKTISYIPLVVALKPFQLRAIFN